MIRWMWDCSIRMIGFSQDSLRCSQRFFETGREDGGGGGGGGGGEEEGEEAERKLREGKTGLEGTHRHTGAP